MKPTGQYTIKPLDTQTWDAFARLLDKHHGAGFGSGCWCTWFHPRAKTGNSAESGRLARSGMYEKAGFAYERPKGKNHCVMRKTVPAHGSPISTKTR